MDVTFTNVLEGARQYFQGLPAATTASPGPTYTEPIHQRAQQPHHSDPNAVPSSQYWPARSQPHHHPPPPPAQPQQFQFSRPQSREAPPSAPHFHHPPTSQYSPVMTPPASSTPTYHQMQTSQYYQTATPRPYYPQPAPRPPTSQDPAYYDQIYPNPQSTDPTYRSSHNLPQIPASYHSNRATSRDVIRSTIAAKNRLPTTTPAQPPKPSAVVATNRTYEPTFQPNHAPNHVSNHYQRDYRPPPTSQYQPVTTTQTRTLYQYPATATTQNYAQVIMTTTNSSYQSSTAQPQYYQPKPPQPQAQQARPKVVKRESPLDLSVKTVRTPADSTLDDEEARKYYSTTIRTVNPPNHGYPTYDVPNAFQRNLPPAVRPTSAPKVEFHPNFGTFNYPRARAPEVKVPNVPRYPTVTAPASAHVNSYGAKHQLPRVDFPPAGHGHKTSALYPAPNHDAQKKRTADTAPSSMIPPKMSKVDTWRQSIDQQIEQRLSSYQQQQAKYKAEAPKPQLNPAYHHKEPYSYQNRSYPNQQVQYPGGYPNHGQNHQNHNQTYVPSAGAHQYPNYGPYPSPSHQNMYPQPTTVKNNVGGADKRVLSLLRNSLEIKGAKEAQKKLEQQEQFNYHKRLDVQHPSTDVTAPVQPKPGYINRQNVSPFTPTNLPENGLTQSMLKFHLPKAIDSVNFETESSKFMSNMNEDNGGDLDGLAAFLAARIRTKAELKQVGPGGQNASNNLNQMLERRVEGVGGSPPKLLKERQAVFPPRRRLFSRSEEEGGGGMPLRDKSGLRSSSETSVFDFPDTDSEGEMPVLERQSLEDMRRDRRTTGKSTEAREEERPPSPGDDVFAQCCDSFVEQLKSGSGKKRGRRKKVEADVLAKLETVTKERPLTIVEPGDREEIIAVVKREVESEGGKSEDDDSDVPLINCAKRKVTPKKETDKEIVLARPAKKPNFGDGSDFCPGWEEEVYKYKKSLRMPPSLIQVTRPPLYHRLSTSLPDLDPCPNSPTPSSVTDDSSKKHKPMDSDTESNFSFNLFHNAKHYDSEEGCSIRSNQHKDSILDKLLEKYGGRVKRKVKRRDDTAPKLVPKAEKLIELLPTPTKDMQESPKKVETARDIAALGFRKKTIDNFKNVFDLKNAKELRLRKNNRKQRVTIKEVFGEDRPASAPPVTCVNNIKIKEEFTDLEDSVSLSNLIKIKQEPPDTCVAELTDTKQVLKNKLLNRSGRKDLLKTLVDKKIKSELLLKREDDEEIEAMDVDCKSEPAILIDENEESNQSAVSVVGKKRSKFTKIRRKFSSGFDYIRKKKKTVKKPIDANGANENSENGVSKMAQQRQRSQIAKNNPGSIQDIQKEIKGWVLNKGIGETILHRSARLGYTDITAYCLENMECSPSPKDNAGYTPLHEASTKGHLGIAKMLLLYGANVSESARGGIRPLHEAVENGFVEVVRLLLSYGADPKLATYAGVTPLALASDEPTNNLLQNHINDVQGDPSSPWVFPGPATCFDATDTGFDILADEPSPDALLDEEDIDFEMSDYLLPNLYTLRGEPPADRWILLQDLSNLLKIKSRDALLRQINNSSGGAAGNKSVLRELKMSDFLEQAHCCQFLNIGEKINTRASKIALVKYTDKVKELLKIEKVTISISR